MVSFELGKEIEKDVFRLVTSVGQSKKNPMEISQETVNMTIKWECMETKKKSLNDS